MGDGDAAIRALEALIQNADPNDAELMARTYNALGESYQVTGKPVDATLAYLHVDLLFFRESAAHAEALYGLSQLWDEIGKLN